MVVLIGGAFESVAFTCAFIGTGFSSKKTTLQEHSTDKGFSREQRPAATQQHREFRVHALPRDQMRGFHLQGYVAHEKPPPH